MSLGVILFCSQYCGRKNKYDPSTFCHCYRAPPKSSAESFSYAGSTNKRRKDKTTITKSTLPLVKKQPPILPPNVVMKTISPPAIGDVKELPKDPQHIKNIENHRQIERQEPTGIIDVKKRPIVYFDITIDDVPAGTVFIELFNETVPKTAENFRALATGL